MTCMRCGKEKELLLHIEAYRKLSDTERCSFPSGYWELCDDCLKDIKIFAKQPLSRGELTVNVTKKNK